MAVFLPPLAANLAKVVAKDEGRYAMSAIRVEDPRNGTYRLEATDGKRAVILRGNSLSGERVPEFRGIKEPVPWALVPLEDWLAGFRMIPKPFARVDEFPLGLKLGKNEVRMASFGVQRTCRPMEGRFPDFSTVIPKYAARVTFTVNPSYMIELLQVAKAILGDEQKVAIHFWKDGAPVGITCHTGDHGGVFFDGLIMPLT